MRPEGLLVELEPTWLHLSSLAIAVGHVTIVDSFFEPRPGSHVERWLAEDPSLSVYMATVGKWNPARSLKVDGPSPPSVAATVSTEPLYGTDKQPVRTGPLSLRSL